MNDKINILTTGGTIQGIDYKNEAEQDSSNDSISISELLSKTEVSKDYIITEVFSKDSRFITAIERQKSCQRIFLLFQKIYLYQNLALRFPRSVSHQKLCICFQAIN